MLKVLDFIRLHLKLSHSSVLVLLIQGRLQTISPNSVLHIQKQRNLVVQPSLWNSLPVIVFVQAVICVIVLAVCMFVVFMTVSINPLQMAHPFRALKLLKNLKMKHNGRMLH